MKLEEARTQDPELYAEAKTTFTAAGVKEEQDRVKVLSDMKKDPRFAKIPQVLAVLDECIATGKSKDDANALIMAELTKNSTQASAESPGPLGTGHVDTATGEADKGAEARQPVTEV